MTEQEQIRTIAELDGCKEINPGIFLGLGCNHTPAKDYLHSLDAIVPVIRKRFATMDSKTLFLDYLYVIVGWSGATNQADARSISQYNAVVAAPDQLCEALLRATNKWKD